MDSFIQIDAETSKAMLSCLGWKLHEFESPNCHQTKTQTLLSTAPQLEQQEK